MSMMGYARPPHGDMHSWAGGTGRVPATAQRVLDAFERYGQILASQLEAISDVPDLDRFNQLAREGDQLARELDSLAAAGNARAHAGSDSSDRGKASPIAAVYQDSLRRRIDECLVTDRRIRERLQQLRDHAATAVSTFDDRRPALDRYAEEPAPRVRVDVRS